MSIEKDYLKLLQEITETQYDDPDLKDLVISEPSNHWGWEVESVDKKKIYFNGIIDATNFRKNQIKDSLRQFKNIRVGEFTIKFSDYFGKDPIAEGKLSIIVYEKKYKTVTGQPCNMDMNCDLTRDSRFKDKSWISLFKGSYGRNIPIDTIIEIIKWMQVAERFTSFL